MTGKAKSLLFLSFAAVVSCGGVLGASAESLRQFAPGSVAVGGEIGRRMDVTLEKMLRHTDIDGVFARHFREEDEGSELIDTGTPSEARQN